jgi:hypothetical protein
MILDKLSNTDLKRNVQLDDIEITGINEPNDKRNAGYNIGDILNMPFLSGNWIQNPHHDDVALKRLVILGNTYSNSILNNYCKDRPMNEKIPNMERIRKSTKEYIDNNKYRFEDIYNFVQQPECLCAHIRSGDLNVEFHLANKIRELSYEFKYIILFSGIHIDETYRDNYNKKNNFISEINYILSLNTNIYLYLNDPDIHLSLMSVASNLLLHKGGFSALGSIVSKNNLFITRIFHHAFHPNWIQNVNKKYILLD